MAEALDKEPSAYLKEFIGEFGTIDQVADLKRLRSDSLLPELTVATLKHHNSRLPILAVTMNSFIH